MKVQEKNTSTEGQNDDPQDRDGEFMNLMSQLGLGWTLAIDRILPKWCDGRLETITVNPEEPISIEMIRELYGGRMLHITVRDDLGKYRGHRSLKFPDPPRDGEGRPVLMPPPESAQPAAQNNANVVGPMEAMGKIFETVLKSQKEQNAQMIGLLEKRLESVERKAEAAANIEYESEPQQNPLDNIKQLAETMRELETLRSDMVARNPEAGPAETSVIDTMVKEFFNLQIEKEKAKLSAMKKQQKEPAPDLPQRNATKPAAPTQQPDASTPPERVSAAHLTNDELAIAVHQRMQKMDQAELNRVMSIFMGQYNLADENGNLDDIDQIDQIDEQPEEKNSGGNGKDQLDDIKKARVKSKNRGTSAAGSKDRAEPSPKSPS